MVLRYVLHPHMCGFTCFCNESSLHVPTSSLTYQVAERLPGFADLLKPVAEEHGTGDTLSLEEVFKK